MEKSSEERYASIKLAISFAIISMMLAGCGKKQDGGDFPKGFGGLSDKEKVQYMIDHAEPDSVARFICNAAMGKLPGIKIDTLAMATMYAYEAYQGDALQAFATAFDDYPDTLPIADKMRLMRLAASEDPMQLGYDLGLGYLNDIRMNRKDAATVDAEIAEMQRACADDTLTFSRFMKGFRAALNYDGGLDVPPEIYKKYR